MKGWFLLDKKEKRKKDQEGLDKSSDGKSSVITVLPKVGQIDSQTGQYIRVSTCDSLLQFSLLTITYTHTHIYIYIERDIYIYVYIN